MRTIKESLIERLALQAEEAELQGQTKVASALTTQLAVQAKVGIRRNDEFYSYPREAFEQDLHSQLWAAALRVADFYGINKFDALHIQQAIEKLGSDLVQEMCNEAGIRHGVGAYEPSVPGEETPAQASIEVDE
jgi:hypothetical protein